MKFLEKHHISFKNAFNGVIWALTTQPNFRVHTVISIGVIIMGILLKVSTVEIAMLTLAITFGFGAEMINTSLEAMTDLITEKYHIKAKIAKDVAAGMMLTIAIGTSILALLIFIPRFISLIS